MKCLICGKDVGQPKGFRCGGIPFEREFCNKESPQEDIDYWNKQLGKHGNGKGGCSVVLCLECYIDKGLFVTLFNQSGGP